MLMRVFNIEYDFDEPEEGEENPTDLPKEFKFDITDTIGETVADLVSDETGWCITSAEYEIILPEGKHKKIVQGLQSSIENLLVFLNALRERFGKKFPIDLDINEQRARTALKASKEFFSAEGVSLEDTEPQPPRLPDSVRKALAHVREFHPEVVQVFFGADGRWLYFGPDIDEVPSFGEEIDIGILEDAQAAAEKVGVPCAFQWIE